MKKILPRNNQRTIPLQYFVEISRRNWQIFEPNPQKECITFRALRAIDAGEELTFDYTSTEDSVFASPFVDIETGMKVG